MPNLYTNFGDPSWWISVVFFGLLLNVIGAYMKSFIDGLLAKMSDSYRRRVEEKNDYYDSVRKSAETDQDLQIRIALEQIRHKTETIFKFIIGVICLHLVSGTAPATSLEGFSKLITWFLYSSLWVGGIASLFSSAYSNSRSLQLGRLSRSFPASRTLSKL